MSKMTKEEFVEKCNNNIVLMSNISGLNSDECAELMYAAIKSFAIDDMTDEEVSRIVDKLNSIGIE